MQTERITLPAHPDKPGEEQWAEIRSADSLRAGDRKAVRGAVRVRLLDDGSVDRSISLADNYARKDALMRRLIVKWSLPEKHPQEDPAVLDELPLDIYDALSEATEVHFQALDFTPQRTGTNGERDSSGSATTSEDTASPDSSPTTN